MCGEVCKCSCDSYQPDVAGPPPFCSPPQVIVAQPDMFLFLLAPGVIPCRDFFFYVDEIKEILLILSILL